MALNDAEKAELVAKLKALLDRLANPKDVQLKETIARVKELLDKSLTPPPALNVPDPGRGAAPVNKVGK